MDFSQLSQPAGMFSGSNMLYWILIGGSMLAGSLVQMMMKRKFTEFSATPSPFTGREIAENMLRQNGIMDVKVTCVEGVLTDHYNPADKTVNLSQGVYEGKNVAAAAVAAHECGHAVQHAAAYHWLGLRSKMVPAVSLCSRLLQWVLLAGIGMMAANGNSTVLGVGIALFAVTTAFAFVTLPVEFDASRRALAWIHNSGTGQHIEHSQAKTALFWAAMTYVVAALASLGQLLYYLSMFMRGSSRSNNE